MEAQQLTKNDANKLTDYSVEVRLNGSAVFDSAFEDACASRGYSVTEVIEDPTLMRHQRLSCSDSQLVALDSLPNNAWRQFEQMAIDEGDFILNAVGVLPTLNVTNPMGTSEIVIPRVDDDQQVGIGMNPESDRSTTSLDYTDARIPLPYTFKRFDFPAQMPAAQMNYLMQVIRHGLRAVNFALERSVFDGTPGTYSGNTAQGLTAAVSASARGSNVGAWNTLGDSGQPALSGTEADGLLIAGMQTLSSRRRYGPYALLMSNGVYIRTSNQFTGQYPGTIRSVLIDVIMGGQVRPSSGLPDSESAANANVYLIEVGGETVQWAQAVAPSVIQWVSPAGYTRHVLVVAKAVPSIVSTYSGAYGIVRWTG